MCLCLGCARECEQDKLQVHGRVKFEGIIQKLLVEEELLPESRGKAMRPLQELLQGLYISQLVQRYYC